MLVSQKAIRSGRHTLAHLKLFEPLSQSAKGGADFLAMQGASETFMLSMVNSEAATAPRWMRSAAPSLGTTRNWMYMAFQVALAG
ncbi:hypothetical protein D3C77_442800 [compost metagenome]